MLCKAEITELNGETTIYSLQAGEARDGNHLWLEAE